MTVLLTALVFSLTFSAVLNIRLALKLHNLANELQALAESLERS